MTELELEVKQPVEAAAASVVQPPEAVEGENPQASLVEAIM